MLGDEFSEDGLFSRLDLEIEKVAREYEVALAFGKRETSIEDLLLRHDLPREALLLSLIDAELDVLGAERWRVDDYCRRFPEYSNAIAEHVADISQPQVEPLSIGEIIGQFEVRKLIGHGAMGYVYQALDKRSGAQVAIKILRSDWQKSCGADYAERFAEEAKLIGRLRHPNIVGLLDTGLHKDLPYHVLQYIEGKTLGQFCRDRVLDPFEASRIIADVAEAIHYSHRNGVVHRDLKPSNILVSDDGKIYVSDFGIALDYGQRYGGDACSIDGFVGTPLYMSPEQARGNSHRLDGRSDVFSLGVILYEITTGSHPFRVGVSTEALAHWIETIPAPPPRQRVDVPEEFEHICLRALARDPVDRYRTAGDFAKALRRFASPWKTSRRSTTAAAVVVLATAAWILFAIYFRPQVTQETLTSHHSPAEQSGAHTLSEVPTASDDTTKSQELESRDVQLMDQSLAVLLPEGTTFASDSERQLAVALICLRMKANSSVAEDVWRYFEHFPDNSMQTALIHACGPAGVPFQILLDRLALETRPDIRMSLILSLGEYSNEQFTPAERMTFLPELLSIYRGEVDPGVHAACEWLLRKWKLYEHSQMTGDDARMVASRDREWFVIHPRIPMIAVDMRKINSSLASKSSGCYAISSYEITESQWDDVFEDRLPSNASNSSSASPKNRVSWHAAAEFCNRLTEWNGYPDSEKCYKPLPSTDGLVRFEPYPDSISKHGFRLPTLSEWCAACKAGTSTQRYWGNSDSLSTQFANFRRLHHESRTMSVGMLKPNRLGLFDMLGNVSEWIHANESQQMHPKINSQAPFHPVCGGSAWTVHSKLTADAEFSMASTELSSRMGLRIAQTMYPSEIIRPTLTFSFRKHLDSPTPTVERESRWYGNLFINGQSMRETIIPFATSSDKSRQPFAIVIENCSQVPQSISDIVFEGDLIADEPGLVEKSIPPGEELEIGCRFLLGLPGLHRGSALVGYQSSDGVNKSERVKLVGHISQPIAHLSGMVVDGDHADIDLGTVTRGAPLQHSLTIQNRGKQVLTVEVASIGQGISADPKTIEKQIPPNRFIEATVSLDTSGVGELSTTLALKLNDPQLPAVNVRYRAKVEDDSSH